MSEHTSIRTLGDEDTTRGGIRYFTEGKANIDAEPLRNRVKHAIAQCMLEAGHARPRWLDEEVGAFSPLAPEGWFGWSPEVQAAWCRACERACDLVRQRMGWPEGIPCEHNTVAEPEAKTNE